MNKSYHIQHYIPNSLAIGDDEGENVLIYATGSKGFGLYLVPFGYLYINALQYVAGSLSELLRDNVGMDVVIDCY